jgi:hypothetical protein
MGIGHFVNMGNVPDTQLVEWTNQIVGGKLTTKEFNKRCILYKKRRRVRACLLEYMLQKIPALEDEGLTDWKNFTDKFPFLNSKEYFNSIVAWFPDTDKTKPERSLMDEVLKRVKLAIKQQKDNPQDALRVIDDLCYQTLMFFELTVPPFI